jgi:hypothetical protein
MMFCRNRKIAFVLVPKCGSTTLRYLLNRHGFSPVTGAALSPVELNHLTYRRCAEKYPNIKNYKVYGVFRDPIDRYVSGINHSNKFDENSVIFKPQVEWLDAKNITVIKLNNLNEEIKNVFTDSTIQLPHLNKAKQNKITKITDEIVEFVKHKYAADYQFAKDVLEEKFYG